MSERPSFFAELKRRNIIRVAIAYVAVSWLVLQAGALIFQTLELSNAISKGLFALLLIGFIPTLVFSWIYELTPEGLKRESEIERDQSITHLTGRRLDYLVIGVMAAVIALLLLDKFVLAPRHGTRAAASVAKVPEPPPAAVEAAPQASEKPAAATEAPDAIPEIAQDPSIAVLPLVNMSEDKANEFFSDGISEELLNLLAKVPELRVIARTSSFGYKGKDTPIPRIARELHVASVLEGSVRKSGDRVRRTVQLIRAKDGSHLWSETYDRTLDDIFKVQDEIAAAVVRELQVKLLGAAPTSRPIDARVYPLILQARALSDRGSAEGRAEAVALAQQALAITPDEPQAWVILGRAYFNQATFGQRPVVEGMRLAKEAAEKALALDPSNAEAVSMRGRIAMDVDRDLPAAAGYVERALQLEPTNLRAINTAAVLLSNIGRFEPALALMEYRVAQDPANPGSHFNLGATYQQAGRYDDAIASIRTALRLSPGTSQAHIVIGQSLLLAKRDAAAALKEFEAEEDELLRISSVPLALHALGRSQEADAAQAAFEQRYGDEQPVFAAAIASYRGQSDVAYEWLDRAIALPDPQLAQALIEPLFQPLHADARWVPLLRRIGLAPEQVAKIRLEVTLPK